MEARALWKRALGAALVHVLLLALWPLVRPAFAPAFRTLAGLGLTVIDPLPGPFTVRFVPGAGGTLAGDLVAMDTIVTVEHRDLRGAGTFGASSFFHAWYPTTVLLALFVAATPLPWRARRGPLLLALALLALFVLARCLTAVGYCLARSTHEGEPLVHLSPGTLRALQLAWHFGWSEMLANYLAPLALWSLCVFRPRRGAD